MTTCSCCNKDNMESRHIKLMWQEKIHEDGSTSSTFEPFLLPNGVLFSSNMFDGTFRGYYLCNKNTGKPEWIWQDGFTVKELHVGSQNTAYWNDQIISNQGNRRFCIDSRTGKTLWKEKNIYSYGNDLSQDEQYIYTGRYLENESWLVRYSFQDPSEYEIYSNLTDSMNMREVTSPPAITTVDNDMWLIYNDGFVNYDTGKGHPWISCYNLTADSMMWRIQISEPWFHAGVSDIPLIHNNRIYVAESFHVVCLDLMTGEEIWRRTENGAFITGGILLAEGKLFAMCENLTLYTINPEDGSLIHAEKNNGSGTRMHYHKGRIYYVGQGDGLLHCIDASTGKHLWTMEGPEYQKDDDLFFDNAGLAIDPETDMLYITDYRYAYGYKILE